ncbi:sigma-70 family RNA polymerase sigma factor [Glycomyces sp. NPDC048151]|uniref:sigma-70 family RNA polymerase sigma factor n=1 Tax=Glycomyces sp. NPDC048151 TaxID=3364002 RepID=UPI003723126E
MSGKNFSAAVFEQHRPHLRMVAFRMLGSLSEAEDAVQEAWLKADRADTGSVENLAGWLTTVVGRVCLDQLRSRKSRREDALEDQEPESGVRVFRRVDPEEEAVLADSVGQAMLVVLDALSPVERLAFVLHDMFGVSFADIAPIVERSPETTQRLASRARQRVRGKSDVDDSDRMRRYRAVDAFLRAARDGEFATLLTLLDPSVTLRLDERALRLSPAPEAVGAQAVAAVFNGTAMLAHPVLLDGEVGVAVVSPRGSRLIMVMTVAFDGDRICGIHMVADRDRLDAFELAVPEGH